MRITGFKLGLLQVPLRVPFKTALRTVEAIEDVIVKLETDTGHIGYGEAPPTVAITGDSIEGILAALGDHIGPALLGRDIADINGNCQRVQNALPKNTSAKAAAEIALYDLYAQYRDMPLYQVLGSGTPRLLTDLTISVNDTETMIADCENAIARGFQALKIKVGKDPEGDGARLGAIRDAVAGRASLRIDANQGWSAEQTIHIMKVLETDGDRFELIEQPVRADNLEGMIAIKAAIRTPLLADESAFNLAQVKRLAERGGADLINIKLMKTGGLSQAIAIADYCRAEGLQCLMGCMLEGGISAAAAVHLAVARSSIITKIDLDGPSLGMFDPIDGNVHFDDAVITVSDRPGLGIRSVSHITWLDSCAH
jgi:L-Ala-D/L-Glu epimerase